MNMYATHRKAIESTYIGKCNVIGFIKTKDGSRTESTKGLVAKNIPCRLSRGSGGKKPANQTNSSSNIEYDCMLFVSPEVEINAGSVVLVTQNGVTTKFEQTGEPFMYVTHQEIPLLRKVRV